MASPAADPEALTPRVLAVVLTYRAPKSLARCLGAVAAQSRPPEEILVIDNDPGQPATLSGLPESMLHTARVLRTGVNVGPAGGYALGLRTFRADDRFTHVWAMDDDCAPQGTVLERLLVAEHTRSFAGRIAFPSWVDQASGAHNDYPGWCGVLIDRVAVERVGLPREEFFWWAEDTEYLQHRMRTSGVEVRRVEEAVVVHTPVRRLAGRPPWKTYYEVRNSVYYRLRVQRRWPVGPIKLVRALGFLLASSISNAPRGEQLKMYGRGLRDGLTGRLGKRVDPPEPLVLATEAHGLVEW